MEAARRIDPSPDDGDFGHRLDEILEEVSHLLPEQAPLHAFVHHNPLHALEHLPFERAAVEAARLRGTEPFQTEDAFAECLRSGRIQRRDIEAVVDDCETDLAAPMAGGVSRRQFLLGRLLVPFAVPSGAALRWILDETDTLSRFHPLVSPQRRTELLDQARRRFGQIPGSALEPRLCRALWEGLLAAAPAAADTTPAPVRPRDRIRAATGLDCDEWVHPPLIRLCAAFLDQGIAYWEMPQRDAGFLSAFRRLYARGGAPPDRWRRGLASECRRQEELGWSAERTIEWALDTLGVAVADAPRAVRETLLSLPGWAGMMRQFELHPERAPVVARPARLADYLAVQLILDVFAVRHARRLAESGTRPQAVGTSGGSTTDDLPLVYEAYVAAQLVAADVLSLTTEAQARSWLMSVRAFDTFERRRLLHLAYERRHRVDVLDGLLANEPLAARRPPAPEFQAVFCIDDREESLRRHLEEIHPACETFGYAGFFGVAMIYQGIDDVRGRPLCPVAVQPRHRIVERVVAPHAEAAYRAARRRRGQLRHGLSVGSKSLARGGLLTAAAGMASVVPLIGRCLFPRTTERLSHRLHAGHAGPTTRLAIEREGDETAGDGLARGYTTAEMAAIVESLLRTTGIAGRCAPLVLVVGHGSSSLNNPHEAAHDCGATGGGRGGPNARAFAAMANHPAVREQLRQRGVSIPNGTWFVGAYHNTCDDSMTYYDDDLIPAACRPRFEAATRKLAAACRRDAHERCRRFGTSPLRLDAEEALAHAEAHAVDLAQPRPEYGHATNAVCIVGRRERTRGLFLDRRAFLVSYDPTTDGDGQALANLLLAVGPVGAGINLEYYFSFVDPTGYGCGTKLPHNIVGLLGVMDGHASDLRTGLPWQMVEIHEPVRLLLVVDAEPEILLRIMAEHPGLDRLVRNGWIQLVCWRPSGAEPAMLVFADGRFRAHRSETATIPIFERSDQFYTGHREHLGCAHLTAAFGAAA